MRVNLKGIHTVRRRLAGGGERIHTYAWRGGPALPGIPGSPEFMAAYHAANAARVDLEARTPQATLLAILVAYQQSPEFRKLAPRTRADYAKHLAKIEARFGSLPLAALADPAVRAVFRDWRDELAKYSLRQADYAWAVLSRALSWAYDRRMILPTPANARGACTGAAAETASGRLSRKPPFVRRRPPIWRWL